MRPGSLAARESRGSVSRAPTGSGAGPSPSAAILRTLAQCSRRARALPQGGLGRPPMADAGRPVTPCPRDGCPSLWGTYPFPTPFAARVATRVLGAAPTAFPALRLPPTVSHKTPRGRAEPFRVVFWWRRRESNPRPETSAKAASTRVAGSRRFRSPPLEPAIWRFASPEVLAVPEGAVRSGASR